MKYPIFITYLLLSSLNSNAQNLFRTWHCDDPYLDFCLVLKDDSVSYIHNLENYWKISIKKDKIVFRSIDRFFSSKLAEFKIKKLTNDSLVLELINDRDFNYFYGSLSSGIIIFKLCDTCSCPCPAFDCHILIDEEEYCSPAGLFHSEDSALIKIIDTIQVEGYLVEYNRKYVSSEPKSFLRRTLLGEKKDTFEFFDGRYFYFDSMDIVLDGNKLDANDSFFKLYTINDFTSTLRSYERRIEMCGLDSIMGNHYIKYPEFTSLSFFNYYDYNLNGSINWIIYDTTTQYEKVIQEKRKYNFYLCRISLKYWERIYPYGNTFLAKFQKDGWLYFVVPVLR